MKYAESLPREVRAEMDMVPVAYLPWGAHEWHGVHMPLGTDGFKAELLAQELAGEVGGVVFPTLYLGHTTVKTLLTPGMPLTLDFSAELVAGLAREYMKELTEAGFRVIVLVLGHWGSSQGGIIRREVEEFNKSGKGALAWAVQDDEMTGDFGAGADHGGMVETSYMMTHLPERVDMSRLPDEISFARDGILGEDPRIRASAELGREHAEIFVREAAERVKKLLSEVKG